MDVVKLAKMANQIAMNFEHGTEKDKVVAAVADHLRRFWNPSMRAQLVEGQRQGKVELSEIAAQGLAAATQPQTNTAA
jgi:formate dehydrogenase subunit delta